MKKKGCDDSRGCVQNSKHTAQYKLLLQDYLMLQKECVSKRKKLKREKRKQDILLEEVRFLRKRRQYFIELESAELDPHKNLYFNGDPIVRKHINCVANENNKTEQDVNDGKKPVYKTESTEKLAQKSRKKKVSWEDKVTYYFF